MKIESKIKRDGGTHVTIGTTNYHFEQQADDAHVADVTDTAHVERFLSIPEGYRIYRAGQQAATPEQMQPVAAPVAASIPVKAGTGHPASFDIGGKTYSLDEVTQLAIAESGLDLDNWNDLEDDERADKIDAELDKLQDAADAYSPPPPVDPAAERAELVKQHVARFGSKPHAKWSVEKIRAALDKS